MGGVKRTGAGSIAALMLAAAVTSGLGAAPPWSSWEPAAGPAAAVSKQIAAHVEAEYRASAAGGPFVGVVGSPPEVKVGTRTFDVSYIAIRTRTDGIRSVTTGKTWMYELCGHATDCAIPGVASLLRGRLVRREALELALDTLKFAPSIDTVAVILPPPPGTTESTLLYLQRNDLRAELSRPLAKTLTSVETPLPDDPDEAEAATIDRLTLTADYTYFAQGLADGTAVLTLEPVS